MKCLLAALAIVLAVSTGCGSVSHDAAPGAAPQPLTQQEQGWLARSSKREVNGWLHVRIQGTPFERGFQHAVWNVPFYPAGSVDGKVTSTALARDLSMWGRFGRADGVSFDADEFLRLHPQWNWQEGYLESRPSEPWTLFRGGE